MPASAARSRPFRLLLTLCGLAVAASGLTGCSNVSREVEFPAYIEPQVWFTAKAVAREPIVNDWVILENNTWVDEDAKRIEIERRLRRDLWGGEYPKPRREDRRVIFRVEMISASPPTVRLTARGRTIPAHTWQEIERYVDDMYVVLRAGAGPGIQP